MTRADYIAQLKAHEDNRPLIVAMQDPSLQRVAAVWSLLHFDPTDPPARWDDETRPLGEISRQDLLAAAWEGIELARADARGLLGQTFDLNEVARFARLGLGYPDGTLHSLMDAWLTAQAVSMTKKLIK